MSLPAQTGELALCNSQSHRKSLPRIPFGFQFSCPLPLHLLIAENANSLESGHRNNQVVEWKRKQEAEPLSSHAALRSRQAVPEMSGWERGEVGGKENSGPAGEQDEEHTRPRFALRQKPDLIWAFSRQALH